MLNSKINKSQSTLPPFAVVGKGLHPTYRHCINPWRV